ncbi:hypothetical protein [Alteribacter populi]|uniref:hypothetical protein n=1 Tax=Alteribacter populi TaxID=2011011 RepID=UPI000BBA5F3F|nr:hypothetical protein [Alteribacter populi]
MKEDGKLWRFLERIAKNKTGHSVLTVIYRTWERVNRIVNYFRKDASVFVQYVHYMDNYGNHRKYPDSFNIHICAKGKCQSLWGSADFTEAQKIVDFLRADKKKAVIEMSAGMGTTSILIPKWAKQTVIDELLKVIEETKQDVEDYRKWAGDGE